MLATLAQGFPRASPQSVVSISPGCHTNTQMRPQPVETVASQSREHTSATVQQSDTHQDTKYEAALKRRSGATVASNYASVFKMQIIVT